MCPTSQSLLEKSACSGPARTVDTHTLRLTPSLLGTFQRQKGQRGWGSKAQGQAML